MKELSVKNKLELKVFVNGAPNLAEMPKQDLDVLISSLTNIIELNVGKKPKNNITQTIDLNDTT